MMIKQIILTEGIPFEVKINHPAYTKTEMVREVEATMAFEGMELTEENKKQFYISEGFAHGYLVLSDAAEFCYKVTDFWHPGDEGGIAWNDPDIGIDWPQLTGEYQGTASAKGYRMEDGTGLILSEKDELWQRLKSLQENG